MRLISGVGEAPAGSPAPDGLRRTSGGSVAARLSDTLRRSVHHRRQSGDGVSVRGKRLPHHDRRGDRQARDGGRGRPAVHTATPGRSAAAEPDSRGVAVRSTERNPVEESAPAYTLRNTASGGSPSRRKVMNAPTSIVRARVATTPPSKTRGWRTQGSSNSQVSTAHDKPLAMAQPRIP